MSRLLLALSLLAVLAGCWSKPPPQVPDECKVTTNPEACRKAFQR